MRKHERFSEVPIAMQEELKLPATTIEIPRVFPSMRDESLIPCSDSNAILHSLSLLERTLVFPEATRGVP